MRHAVEARVKIIAGAQRVRVWSGLSLLVED
jgi:hypothetical protein